MQFKDAMGKPDKPGETSFSGKVEYTTFGNTYDAGTKRFISAIKKAFDPNYYGTSDEEVKKMEKMQKYLRKFNIKKEAPYDFSIEPHENEQGEKTGAYVISIAPEDGKKQVVGIYTQINIAKAMKDPKYMYYLLTAKGKLD